MRRRAVRPALALPALLALQVPAFLVLGPERGLAQEAAQEAPEELLRRADSLAGEAGAAVPLYREWLRANAGAAGSAGVLSRAVDAAGELKDALSLLAEFGPKLPEAAARESAQERLASLLRLSGRLEEALVAQLALPESPARLVERAGLCLEMGLSGEAEQILLRARASGDGEAAATARLLLARLYLATERGELGEQELRALLQEQPEARVAPAALQALGEALRSRGGAAAAAEPLAQLQARFPDSPEALIESGRGVRQAAQPLRLLPPGPPPSAASAEPAPAEPAPAGPAPAGPAPAGPAQAGPAPAGPAPAEPAPLARKALVQAGSFRDPENARYLVRDLGERGFEARVVEKPVGGVRYYRVLVGAEQSPESAQALILRLKDAGYEGFLLLE